MQKADFSDVIMEKFEDVLPNLLKMKVFQDFKIDDEEDRRIMQLVYKNLYTKTFKAGEIIIKQGELGDLFYILRSGSVQLSQKTMAGDYLALANLNAEQNVFFGEVALLGQERRSETVKALTDCKTVVLSSSKYIDICEKEPLLGYRVTLYIAKSMAESLKKKNADMATLYEALFNEIEGFQG